MWLEHMYQSLSISAQLTYMSEVDITEVVKLRNELLSQAEAIGARITYTDIFVFALTKALKDNPIINSSSATAEEAGNHYRVQTSRQQYPMGMPTDEPCQERLFCNPLLRKQFLP